MSKSVCTKCGLVVCNPCVPAPANGNVRQVVAANDNELADPDKMQTLATVSKAHGHTRRSYLDFLAETIFWFDGEIVGPDGRPFPVNDSLIDDAFPGGDGRWLSDFWKWADKKPRQRAQARVIGRLRVIRIASEIIEPEVRHRFRRLRAG